MTAAVRLAVWQRDGGWCQLCGRDVSRAVWPGSSVHHRKPRGMGGGVGSDGLANLVLLCGSGDTGCHGWVEGNRSEGYRLGFLVRRNDDPAAVPLCVFARPVQAQVRPGWVLLGDDGAVSPCAPPHEVELQA